MRLFPPAICLPGRQTGIAVEGTRTPFWWLSWRRGHAAEGGGRIQTLVIRGLTGGQRRAVRVARLQHWDWATTFSCVGWNVLAFVGFLLERLDENMAVPAEKIIEANIDSVSDEVGATVCVNKSKCNCVAAVDTESFHQFCSARYFPSFK